MGKILLGFDPDTGPAEQIAEVEALAPDMEIVVTRDPRKIDEILDEVEIAAGWLRPERLVRARNLRWLQQWGAGADWLMEHPEVAERDFVLTNASGVHAIPISEHILAFLFAFARGLHRAVRAGAPRVELSRTGGRV